MLTFHMILAGHAGRLPVHALSLSRASARSISALHTPMMSVSEGGRMLRESASSPPPRPPWSRRAAIAGGVMSPACLLSSPAAPVHAATADTFLLGKGPKALEVCLHVCINLCVCVCVYVCSPAAPVCMYADVSAYTTSCCVAGQGPQNVRGMSICTYISTFVCVSVHVCVLARVCVCVCVVCAQKHTNKHTHTRTHTHTHLHTHTHTHRFPKWGLAPGRGGTRTRGASEAALGRRSNLFRRASSEE